MVVVVKGYTEYRIQFLVSISLSLSLSKYQLTKIDRLCIYILKKIPLPGYRTFHGVLIRYKEEVDERKLNNFEETSSFVAFKGILLPPVYIPTSALCFIKKRAIYLRARGTGTREREREKNVCLNFAFLCVAPCSSTRLDS